MFTKNKNKYLKACFLNSRFKVVNYEIIQVNFIEN